MDWDAPDSSSALRFSGGYSSHDGALVNEFGPLASDADRRAFGRVDFERGSLTVSASAHTNRVEYRLPCTLGPSLEPLQGRMALDSFELNLSDSRVLGERHLLHYGANARGIAFDFELAPLGDGRSELGAFLQDEIFLTDRLRWIVGGRADRNSALDGVIFSPATAVVFKPSVSHSLRASWSRMFRAPSLNNNFLSMVIGAPVEFDLGLALRDLFPGLSFPDSRLPDPVVFVAPVGSRGSTELRQETLNTWEIGYSGALSDQIGATASVYVNELSDPIFFDTRDFWGLHT